MALTAKVLASRAMAVPAPVQSTRNPPIALPATSAVLRVEPQRPFAWVSCSEGMIC